MPWGHGGEWRLVLGRLLPSSFSSNTGGLWEWFPPIFRRYMPGLSFRDVRCRILTAIRDAGCSWDAVCGMRAQGCRMKAAVRAASQGCSVCRGGRLQSRDGNRVATPPPGCPLAAITAPPEPSPGSFHDAQYTDGNPGTPCAQTTVQLCSQRW